jgi:hypothetical protein
VTFDSRTPLDDDGLRRELSRLAARERGDTARLVAHLAELDRRGSHILWGFRSLFEYCCGELRLSEHEAFNRIEAARLARRLPGVLGPLADGSVNLTTLRVLGPVLTDENHRALLDEARHKRKWQVEEIAARVAPRPDVPPVIRPMVTPLAPGRYEVRFTVSRETLDKLNHAQDLLGHPAGSRDIAAVFDRALTVLVTELLKTKCGVTDRPRRAKPMDADTHDTPAAVKRVVWNRDGGRCRYVGPDGRRCTATSGLQFHHVKPWAVNGPPTVENIELRCGPHNRLESAIFFAASRAGGEPDPAVHERRAPYGGASSRQPSQAIAAPDGAPATTPIVPKIAKAAAWRFPRSRTAATAAPARAPTSPP